MTDPDDQEMWIHELLAQYHIQFYIQKQDNNNHIRTMIPHIWVKKRKHEHIWHRAVLASKIIWCHDSWKLKRPIQNIQNDVSYFGIKLTTSGF